MRFARDFCRPDRRPFIFVSIRFWPAYCAYLRLWGQQTNCQQLSIFSIWTVKLHANPIKLLTLRRSHSRAPPLTRFRLFSQFILILFRIVRVLGPGSTNRGRTRSEGRELSSLRSVWRAFNEQVQAVWKSEKV